MSADQLSRFTFAVEAAKRAAKLTLDRYQDDALRIDTKLDRTLVTEADRNAEKLLRELLAEKFPKDAIVGEEFGNVTGTTGWTWYLDPIDGTQAYARGVPLFGTLVGATLDGVSTIGVVVLPALNEAVYAAKGTGATWEREVFSAKPRRSTARVSSVRDLKSALFCTTYGKNFTLLPELTATAEVSRGWGDCYGYALVATGRAEIMIDPQMASWDAGPMPVLLAEAGGRYTSFDGRSTVDAGNGVATNGHLHDEILKRLATLNRP
jgi:histidinol phosphatase-like enzyme (inositol monophosphatase family)